MDETYDLNTEQMEAPAAPGEDGGAEPAVPETEAPETGAPETEITETGAPELAEEDSSGAGAPEEAEGAVPPEAGPNPFPGQAAAAPQPAPRAKRPFFSDTWQILRQIFTSRCGNILAVASTDDHPTWAANLTVCLAADLAALVLLCLRIRSLFPFYMQGVTGILAGGAVGGLLSFAAADFLRIAAVKVLLLVLNRNASFTRVANVVTACLLVGSAFTLAGGLLSLVFPTLMGLGSVLGGVTCVILLYVGVKQFLEQGREPVWPYVWTTVIYSAAAAVAAVILLVLFLGGALVHAFSGWYF